MNEIEIIRFGDQACIIKFGAGISISTSNRVMGFCQELNVQDLPGITDMIPAYDSLTILFDVKKLSFEDLKKSLKAVQLQENYVDKPLVRLPVCYDFGTDKENFCRTTDLSWKEIVILHSKIQYHIFMIGFLPGFLYLGEVDPAIQLPRKKVPEKHVEKGSVGVADSQTGIYPMKSPGGWNIVGRTPVSLFNPANDYPFPIEIGSKVEFYKISKGDFTLIQQDQHYQIEIVNGG